MAGAGLAVGGVREYLPRGNMLDAETFRRRHLLLCWVLGLHIPALFLFGLWQDFSAAESALEMATPTVCLVLAQVVGNRRLAAFFVTAGLVFCSSVLVHFSGGMIEAHFHFFILIGLIALYQDWVPFFWNVVFTVLSHGMGSWLAADSMFNHHAGQHRPWTWAIIHGVSVLAASIGVLVFWKNTEREQQRSGNLASELAASELASVQAEATQRRSVSELLVNLARRNQSLLDRQLALIAELEQRERDPEPLSELFQLDHLATRIRRNAESLLVLSGDETPRLWGQPMPLAEVVRAAAAEVEHYRRVDIEVNEYLDIAGQIVADLAHLLAELIENATTFSPPNSRVRVRSAVLPSEWSTVTLSVEDTGMGMSDSDIAVANEVLAYAPEVDLRSSQLGFHVVSRLARRYRMQVRLAHTPGGGVTALVGLPHHLVSERATSVPPAPLPPTDRLVPPAYLSSTAPPPPPPPPVAPAPAPRELDAPAPAHFASQGLGLPPRAPDSGPFSTPPPAPEPAHLAAPPPPPPAATPPDGSSPSPAGVPEPAHLGPTAPPSAPPPPPPPPEPSAPGTSSGLESPHDAPSPTSFRATAAAPTPPAPVPVPPVPPGPAAELSPLEPDPAQLIGSDVGAFETPPPATSLPPEMAQTDHVREAPVEEAPAPQPPVARRQAPESLRTSRGAIPGSRESRTRHLAPPRAADMPPAVLVPPYIPEIIPTEPGTVTLPDLLDTPRRTPEAPPSPEPADETVTEDEAPVDVSDADVLDEQPTSVDDEDTDDVVSSSDVEVEETDEVQPAAVEEAEPAPESAASETDVEDTVVEDTDVEELAATSADTDVEDAAPEAETEAPQAEAADADTDQPEPTADVRDTELAEPDDQPAAADAGEPDAATAADEPTPITDRIDEPDVQDADEQPPTATSERTDGRDGPRLPAPLDDDPSGWAAPTSSPLGTTPPGDDGSTAPVVQEPEPAIAAPDAPPAPTASGLARRVPGAALAPGLRRSPDSSPDDDGSGSAADVLNDRERVRSMLSHFQASQMAGRAASAANHDGDDAGRNGNVESNGTNHDATDGEDEQ